METILTILWIMVGVGIYLLPSIIANHRNKKNPGVILVINLFLGWTMIFWIIALAMAFGETE